MSTDQQETDSGAGVGDLLDLGMLNRDELVKLAHDYIEKMYITELEAIVQEMRTFYWENEG